MDEPTQKYKLAEDQTQEAAQPARTIKFILKFLGGFLGWYLVMGLIYTLLKSYATGTSCSGPLLFMQIGAYISLLVNKKTTDIGWGVLSALGVNLVISLVLGLTFNAFCAVPFFFHMHIVFE